MLCQFSVSFQNDDLGTSEIQLQGSVGFLNGFHIAVRADDAGGRALQIIRQGDGHFAFRLHHFAEPVKGYRQVLVVIACIDVPHPQCSAVGSTFAEAMLAYIGTGALVLGDVNWLAALSAGGFGFITAILLAMTGQPEADQE